jgi:hypothetical protein
LRPAPRWYLASVSSRTQSFFGEFDDEFPLRSEVGNNAYFGENVLQGLVEGIDDFISLRQARWRRYRAIGPALLGSAMWIDDDALIAKLGHLSAACIIVTKQGRGPRDLHRLFRLHEVNAATPGLPLRAFPDLRELAQKLDDKPIVVGPYSSIDDEVLPTVRTLGYRRQRGRIDLTPILHAKLALLGHLWWHDEGPLGEVDDFVGFSPGRLWVSSANFTRSSRRSLEFGYWTENPALLEGTQRFLLGLIRASEGLDPLADIPDPTLAPVELDDDAFAEYLAESDWNEAVDDDGEGS